MQLTHWNPRPALSSRRSLFPSVFDDFFAPLRDQGGGALQALMPSVDIYEKEGKVFFEAEVPGYSKDDLHVDVHGKVITFSGERREEKNEGENSYRRERRYGRFERSFRLDFEADKSNVEAKYENGILTVVVDKPEEEKAKQIQIH